MNKDIEQKHLELFDESFPKRGSYRIHYYQDGEYMISKENEETRQWVRVAGVYRKYEPTGQSFYTYLPINEAIELAKLRASEYSAKFLN